MVTKKETRYLRLMQFVTIFLLVFGIFSLAFCFYQIYFENSIKNNMFELFYMAVHFIILILFFLLISDAFKKGSHIMRTLMYNRFGQVSHIAPFAFGGILLLGLALFIWTILIMTPTGVYDFKFPIALKWDMLNASLTLIVYPIFFILFPFLFAKNPANTKEKERELNSRRTER